MFQYDPFNRAIRGFVWAASLPMGWSVTTNLVAYAIWMMLETAPKPGSERKPDANPT